MCFVCVNTISKPYNFQWLADWWKNKKQKKKMEQITYASELYYWFIYLFIYRFIYSLIYLFIYLFIYLLIYLFTYLLIYLLIDLFIYWFIYLHCSSRIHPLPQQGLRRPSFEMCYYNKYWAYSTVNDGRILGRIYCPFR